MAWKKVALLFLSAVASPVLGLSVPATHIVHEKRDVEHERWIKRERCDADKLMPMRVGLAQSNLDKAHEHLLDV